MKKTFLVLWLISSSIAFGQTEWSLRAGRQRGVETGNVDSTQSNTYPSQATTQLFGLNAIPADISSTFPGAQILIDTEGATLWPFAIFTSYRNGSSGERYYSGFTNDGHFQTNQYVVVSGGDNPGGEPGGYMAAFYADVPTVLSLANNITDDAGGGKLISGWGNRDGQGKFNVRDFEVSSQGTVTVRNKYGQTGAKQYDRPQIVLGDIGSNVASPSWTYGALHQKAGHTYIGTYTGSGGSGDEGKEIDVTSGKVAIENLTAGKISDQLLNSAAASVTFSAIPQTYTHLRIVCLMRVDTTSQNVWMTFNGDTGRNYRGAGFGVGGNNVWSGVYLGTIGGTDSYDSYQASMAEAVVSFYRETTFNKQATVQSAVANGSGGAENINNNVVMWLSPNAIASITIIPQGGNFIAGSHFILYGFN